ncbi:homoprotocatechuate degradation operon regulator HpaR [Castellaniella defragrans]|jgi:homoprotocatechuate degradation regulator HpaR|uniref:Homoprotocatechuate degradative operon repressor n=2 Tax=Castellaniella defragrans TaxID=75697 RepID=W8XA02_CASD6|nr:homoprotocatechuate degradation operon regulator HpaR [Castellaniella defragrans]KAB0621253.1 homoprotocatechuate degradation operon regulator HpaR [Castellaniella defragrans]MBB6083765.1 homoprotocatechuate degradation regulator HpaR [Castellaniella defragrans]CDM25720.1 Homoprotocatechuate degradative operon repressor [Castellaniella defragrans 65Phen]
MSTPKIHRNLPQLLLKARDALLGHFRGILTHYGLTEQQWRIVRSLREQGPLEPNQLCDACQILSPSMVGVLNRMQMQELVVRERAPHDQRRIIISLTPQGEAVYDRIAPLVEAQYQLIEAAIGRDLIDQTYAQIDRLLSAPLDRVPAVELPPLDTED